MKNYVLQLPDRIKAHWQFMSLDQNETIWHGHTTRLFMGLILLLLCLREWGGLRRGRERWGDGWFPIKLPFLRYSQLHEGLDLTCAVLCVR